MTTPKTTAAKSSAPEEKTVAAKAAPTKSETLKAAPKVSAKKATAKPAANTKAKSAAAPVLSALGNVPDISGNITAGARIYVEGVMNITRTVGGYGKELVEDTVSHAKESMSAKCVGDLSQLQASFVQRRIENATSHASELTELARDTLTKTYASIKPENSSDKAA